jgi:hypothetical protein
MVGIVLDAQNKAAVFLTPVGMCVLPVSVKPFAFTVTLQVPASWYVSIPKLQVIKILQVFLQDLYSICY